MSVKVKWIGPDRLFSDRAEVVTSGDILTLPKEQAEAFVANGLAKSISAPKPRKSAKKVAKRPSVPESPSEE